MPSGPGRASHTARAQPVLGGAEAVPQRRRQQRPEPLVEQPDPPRHGEPRRREFDLPIAEPQTGSEPAGGEGLQRGATFGDALRRVEGEDQDSRSYGDPFGPGENAGGGGKERRTEAVVGQMVFTEPHGVETEFLCSSGL